MSKLVAVLLLFSTLLISSTHTLAALTEEELSRFVIPPMELGPKDRDQPIWYILNSGGTLMGYVFESNGLVPIPGFSGIPMNLLIHIDTSGTFVDVKLLEQNEPVFVSGLGERPFHDFLRQYRGQSLASNIKVLPAQASKSIRMQNGANTYIDGITKATASVRIANETILASALKVAREKLANIAPKPARRPRQDLFQKMNWQQLVDKGLIKNLQITNRQVQQSFADTLFADDDSEAVDDPQGLYLDIWIADLGLPSVAKNILTPDVLNSLRQQLKTTEEPLLVVANGRHQLVKDDFVRNSSPDLMAIRQQDFPISLLDADADIEFLNEIPDFDQAMILRADTRYGFDPSSSWNFIIKSQRKHGIFQPAIGNKDFIISHTLDDHYFEKRVENAENVPLWLAPWIENKSVIILICFYLSLLSYYLFHHRHMITRPQRLSIIRFSLLLFTVFFVGWQAQGQLSIVTLLGFFRAIFQTHNFTFLLYDPVTLILWVYVLASLVVWGRGTFCGWLCPFGALQEFAHLLGNKLGIKEIKLSSARSSQLGWIKYAVLSILLISLLIAPSVTDKLVEIEPFKTSITLSFQRSWTYVLYALACILASAIIFKGYCRFICPLGAALALGGKLRLANWLIRRDECGTPCKLCMVTCRYNAIVRDDGSIKYDDCFQCLECVEIHDDNARCVPLVQFGKKQVSD